MNQEQFAETDAGQPCCSDHPVMCLCNSCDTCEWTESDCPRSLPTGLTFAYADPPYLGFRRSTPASTPTGMV